MTDNADYPLHSEASSTQPKFRESRPADESAIRKILAEANRSFQSGPASKTADPAAFRTHVCELRGEVISVLQWLLIGPEAEVLDIAVAAAHRRRGIASFVLTEFSRLAQAAGVREILLEVRESNSAAIRLYTKFGFTPAGRRNNYYRDPNEAALLLRRSPPG